MSGGNSAVKVLLVGLLAIIGGVASLVLLPRLAGGGEARVRDVAPMSASELRDSPAGAPVVVEGVVSLQNETRYRSLVAYRRLVSIKGPDGQSHPVEEDRVSPPLLIELADGPVQLEGGYRLEETTRGWSTPQYTYAGFDQGNEVLVVGERTAAGTIKAEIVAGGTRDSYLLRKALGRWSFYVEGLCAVVIGVLMVFGSLLALRARARRP